MIVDWLSRLEALDECEQRLDRALSASPWIARALKKKADLDFIKNAGEPTFLWSPEVMV